MSPTLSLRALGLLVAAGLTLPAVADSGRKVTSRPAKVRELYQLRWHTALDGALKEAAAKDRPVMVFRVLGELDGFL